MHTAGRYPATPMKFPSRFTRCLLVLAAFAGLLLTAAPALATTWYVRVDGGTSTQCTGTTNAAYPGSGSNRACAFNHPFWALAPGNKASNYTPATVMKPGDTLMIESGSYMIGYGAPNANNNMCYQPATWGCTIASIPSGIDASHPTVVTGDCSAPPELWGTQRVSSIFDVEQVHDVVIKCLELTDHSMCIEAYQPTSNTGGVTACSKSSYPYGTWAANGIYAADVVNLTLQDLDIHGFADYGINSGRLSGNTLLDSVTLRANGWGGWSGDLGGNNHNSSNSGTITVQNSTVAWNGCAEAYPATTIVGCWGQNEGGYGDGFSEAWTGGNWIFSNDSFISNTQDGLDMLYANGTGSVTMDRLYAWENAGNGVKTTGQATLTNSIINGYCNNWAGFPIAGNNSSGVSGTMCRANGTAVVMEFNGANQTATLAYNTITGDGDTLFIGGGSDAGYTPTSSNVTSMYNNVLLGQVSVIPRDGGALTSLAWFTDGTYNGVTNYSSNVIWNVRNNFCPGGNICKDPQLTNETLAGFNANPLTSSPALGNANRGLYSVAWDFYGNPRSATGPLDIGAVANRGQPYLGSGGGDSPLPPSGGTQPASDAPVPTAPQASANPVLANPGSGYQSPLRERLRERLAGERTLPPGSTVGLSRAMLPAQSRLAATAKQASAGTPVANAGVPAAAAAGPAATPSAKAAPATRSYLLAVIDWFADLYHKSRQALQY